MQLPSNKVGLVLIIVVLFVSGSIIFSKIEFTRPIKPLEEVELVIARNTDAISGQNWLDEFNQTQLANQVDPRPTFEGSETNPDSITSKLSRDLFAEYLALKQKGLLSMEDEQKLVENISQKATAEASLKPVYFDTDITTTISTNETVNIYGDRVAQVTIEFLNQLDSFKNTTDITLYLGKLSEQHQVYIDELLQISVPTVVKEVHVHLLNGVHDTKVFFKTLAEADQDPISSLVIVSQYQARELTENQLYTLLAQYFKNNGIIFETESTNRFWNIFQ